MLRTLRIPPPQDWAEADDTTGDEACVLIGEEQAEDGKAWFVCTEPSDDPAMDCSPAEAFGGACAHSHGISPPHHAYPALSEVGANGALRG